MCACVSLCVYAIACGVCACICKSMCMQVWYMHICLGESLSVCEYLGTCLGDFECMCMYVCAFLCVCVHTFIYCCFPLCNGNSAVIIDLK